MDFKIFIFFSYTELFASVIERNETLWTKLNTFKAKTGISDDVMMSIWEKGRRFEFKRSFCSCSKG